MYYFGAGLSPFEWLQAITGCSSTAPIIDVRNCPSHVAAFWCLHIHAVNPEFSIRLLTPGRSAEIEKLLRLSPVTIITADTAMPLA